MVQRRLLEKLEIARSDVKRDLLLFALPGMVILFFGISASARDGYQGLPATLWRLIRYPSNLYLLSANNILGLALIFGGFTLAITAHITIGRYHTATVMIRKGHKLITHGVYRYVRNPIYLGILLVCFGVPVYASSVRGLLIMLALVPIIHIRIWLEERLLIEEFGNDYRDYRERTKKLIPFIY